MNDGSSATCAVNFMRNDDEEKKRAADEAKKKDGKLRGEDEKFSSGNRFKKIYHTEIFNIRPRSGMQRI